MVDRIVLILSGRQTQFWRSELALQRGHRQQSASSGAGGANLSVALQSCVAGLRYDNYITVVDDHTEVWRSEIHPVRIRQMKRPRVNEELLPILVVVRLAEDDSGHSKVKPRWYLRRKAGIDNASETKQEDTSDEICASSLDSRDCSAGFPCVVWLRWG